METPAHNPSSSSLSPSNSLMEVSSIQPWPQSHCLVQSNLIPTLNLIPGTATTENSVIWSAVPPLCSCLPQCSKTARFIQLKARDESSNMWTEVLLCHYNSNKYWTLLNAQEMAGYRNYVVSQRGSRGDIQKLMTDNHQVVHFNLQFFLPIKTISYKKGIFYTK